MPVSGYGLVNGQVVKVIGIRGAQGASAGAVGTQNANWVYAGPTSGSPALPTFRALVAADIPSLGGIYQPLDADLTAISALAGTSGFLKKTAANTWALDTASYALTSHDHSGVYEPANANIQAHIASTANPHNVTKSQVGLGSVENIALSTWAGSTAITSIGAATATSLALSGTAGAGFITYIPQSSAPGAPGSGLSIFADSTGRFSWIRSSDGFVRKWDATLTADRVYTLPDVSGTVITSGNLTAITATGTIASGIWNGTAIGDSYISSASTWNAKISASSTDTLTNKTISGASNTLSNIGNASLTNSAITIAGTSTSLGGSISLDTITGLSSTGIIKRTGANTLAIATAGTDYENALTFSTGLTRSTNTITVNTSQNIATLSNLTSNGLVTTSGGAGTLGVTVPGTGVLTALAVNVGSAGAFVTNGGALGTPSSGTLTNATGLPPTTGIVGWPANASGVLTNNGSGTLSWAAASGGSPGGSSGDYQINNSGAFGAGVLAQSAGRLTATPTAQSSGVAPYFRLITPADTTQTASTEAVGAWFGGNSSGATVTRQWATGTLTTQRENVFVAPTYSFAGASTLTTAATVAISGAPVAGTNATITNPLALLVQAGRSEFPTGSASAPAITFGQSNTGIYQQTNPTIDIAISGVRVFAVSGTSAYITQNTGLVIGTNFDLGFAWKSAGVARISDGSTGSGQLLIAPSSATIGAQLHAVSGSASRVGLRVDSAANSSVDVAAFNLTADDTSTVANGVTFAANSNGTAAAGFGQSHTFTLESSTTNDQTAMVRSVFWTTATHASRRACVKWDIYDTAAREAFRIEASGSAPMIGFLGASAVARQTVSAAASDAATTQTLVNEIRTALINLGLCV